MTTMKVAATLACLALLIVVQCGSLVHASASLELDSTAKGATTTATLKFTPTQNFNGSSTAGITIPIPGMALGTNATATTTAAPASATTTAAPAPATTTAAHAPETTTAHAPAETTAAPSGRRLLAASACTVLPSSIGGTCSVSYASGVLTINLLSGSYTTTVPVSISISNFVVPTTAIPAISLTVLSNVNSAASAIFTVVVQVPVLTTPGPYFKPLSSASIGFINCVCVAIVFAISAMSIL